MCLQGLMQFNQRLFKILKKLSIQKSLRLTKGNNSNSIGPKPLVFISSICLVHMNVFAKFDEIPSLIFQDIKETKRYGHMDSRKDGQTNQHRENSIPSHKYSLPGFNYSLFTTLSDRQLLYKPLLDSASFLLCRNSR